MDRGDERRAVAKSSEDTSLGATNGLIGLMRQVMLYAPTHMKLYCLLSCNTQCLSVPIMLQTSELRAIGNQIRDMAPFHSPRVCPERNSTQGSSDHPSSIMHRQTDSRHSPSSGCRGRVTSRRRTCLGLIACTMPSLHVCKVNSEPDRVETTCWANDKL
ncbi:hypothetical protein BKA93DRAFT_111627 [Sparassis latifolia]